MKKTVFLLALILPVCALVAQLPAPVIPLDGNISAVVQMGDDNSYTLTQDGTRNFAEVTTIGDKNAASVVDQNGAWNTSTVEQFSDKSYVDVTQTNDAPQNGWDLNFSYIEQTGEKHDATVVQNHRPYGSSTHPGPLVAYAFQSGTNNSSVQKQEGMIDLAIVNQAGENGTAIQKQGMSDYKGGHGYGNLAIIDQLSTAKGSESEQQQVGAWNVAGIMQGSDKSQARQLQISDKDGHIGSPVEMPNVAGIFQMEGATTKGNEAYQVQYYDGTSPYGNWAGAVQIGGHNTSMQVQAGGNNVSGVLQVGDGNNSDVWQSNGATLPVANPW
jgi:hypothetical protein